MKLSIDKIKTLCKKNGWTLNDLLRKSGVSRTAYYSLTRKNSVVPKSIHAIARQLGLSTSCILQDTDQEKKSARLIFEKALWIARKHRNVNPDNVRHTLLLLKEKPVERLRKGLLRGRVFGFHS